MPTSEHDPHDGLVDPGERRKLREAFAAHGFGEPQSIEDVKEARRKALERDAMARDADPNVGDCQSPPAASLMPEYDRRDCARPTESDALEQLPAAAERILEDVTPEMRAELDPPGGDNVGHGVLTRLEIDDSGAFDDTPSEAEMPPPITPPWRPKSPPSAPGPVGTGRYGAGEGDDLLLHLFDVHQMTPEDVERSRKIRDAGHDLAAVIAANSPPSADQTTAIRQIRLGVMWAVAAIALGGRS